MDCYIQALDFIKSHAIPITRKVHPKEKVAAYLRLSKLAGTSFEAAYNKNYKRPAGL